MRGRFMALVLVAGVVAACGSSAPAATPFNGVTLPPGATPVPTPTPLVADACTLLTTDEVAAALGGPVNPGQEPDPNMQSCSFTGNDPAKNPDPNAVTVSMTNPGDFAAGKSTANGFTVTPVTGIGDDAYYLSTADATQLEVSKNGASFEVSIVKPGATIAHLQDAEKQLALLVLGRL
jgi:hypothetical protein